MTTKFYHALIRTHHITSRKKVAVLKAAAKKLDCYVLLRSGGVPGVMYVEGRDQPEVQKWIDTVHGLRYKDYHLASAVDQSSSDAIIEVSKQGVLEEVSTVKEMGALMKGKGLSDWWRYSMGFNGS